MFSGIVTRMGTIETLDVSEARGRLRLKTDAWDQPVVVGESLAVQGICLTVVAVEGEALTFDLLRETVDRTTLREKRAGLRLNMERSLRWGDTMGGHIVVGHVDGVGRVRTVARAGRDWVYRIDCGADLLDGIVNKGSVAVDGVSLTVAELFEDGFSVHIIPYTWEETTFHALEPGHGVNLEIDLLGKFVRRLLERGRVLKGVTWETLRAAGLITEEPLPPPRAEP